jgi:hypothetical protein
VVCPQNLDAYQGFTGFKPTRLDTPDTRTVKLAKMRGFALPVLAFLLLVPGCGSDDDKTPPSATEVEQSLKIELSTGGGGGRVVDLGMPPKLVRCEKDANQRNGWRCTVTPTTGKNVLCLVDVDQAGKPVKTVCGPVDN